MKEVDCIIICVGLSGEWEFEGFDCLYMDFFDGVDDMIWCVLEVVFNVVVVN